MTTPRPTTPLDHLHDDIDRVVRGEAPAAMATDPEYGALLDAAGQLSRELGTLRQARPGYQAALEARLLAQLPQATRPWWRVLPARLWRPASAPSHRLAVGLVTFLVAILFAGGTAAVLPLVNRPFERYPNTQRIVAQNLGKEVGLSQTVGGFTISVERVYADANLIAIGYTLSGPPDRTFQNISVFGRNAPPVLTDDRGHRFDLGPRGFPFAWGTGPEAGTSGNVLVYDGAGLGGNPAAVTLRLEIAALWVHEQVAPDRRPSGRYECNEQTSPVRCFLVEGPFVFEVTVPIAPGRTLELGQTVTVDGRAVTLERLILTPTGTRVDLRGVGPHADVHLTLDGVTHRLAAPDVLFNAPLEWPPDGVWSYVSAEPLLDRHGLATLEVRPGRHQPSQPTVTGGPWTFRLTVP